MALGFLEVLGRRPSTAGVAAAFFSAKSMSRDWGFSLLGLIRREAKGCEAQRKSEEWPDPIGEIPVNTHSEAAKRKVCD
jgi:hypothetical protein